MSRRGFSEDRAAIKELATVRELAGALMGVGKCADGAARILQDQIKDQDTDARVRRNLVNYLTGQISLAQTAITDLARAVSALRSAWRESAPLPGVRRAAHDPGGATPEPGEPAPVRVVIVTSSDVTQESETT